MSYQEKTQSHCRWPDVDNLLDDQLSAELYQRCLPEFMSIVDKQQLDNDFSDLLNTVYLPLAAWVANKHQQHPVVIGINGAQGSGKSTLGKLLRPLLSRGFNKNVVELSIDDLYLSRHQREHLAKDVHPLLRTRGVPGTHDVALGMQILSRLKSADFTGGLTIPVFDKSQDDLLPEDQWRMIAKPADIILFEGWCVGARAQKKHDLDKPVNQLEAVEDDAGIWRHYVNQQLAGPYQSLFDCIDHLIMLKVPDMDCVFSWRNLQEQKLAAQCKHKQQSASHIMSAEQVARFIMYYERITRFILEEMPQRTDLLIKLDKQHQIENVIIRQEA